MHKRNSTVSRSVKRCEIQIPTKRPAGINNYIPHSGNKFISRRANKPAFPLVVCMPIVNASQSVAIRAPASTRKKKENEVEKEDARGKKKSRGHGIIVRGPSACVCLSLLIKILSAIYYPHSRVRHTI